MDSAEHHCNNRFSAVMIDETILNVFAYSMDAHVCGQECTTTYDMLVDRNLG